MSHGNEDARNLISAQYIIANPSLFAKFEIDWAKDIIKLLGD